MTATKVEGPAGLRKWILGYSDQYVRVATEKLLTYALGRGVEPQDMPLVRKIVRDACAQQLSFFVTGARRCKKRAIS